MPARGFFIYLAFGGREPPAASELGQNNVKSSRHPRLCNSERIREGVLKQARGTKEIPSGGFNEDIKPGSERQRI